MFLFVCFAALFCIYQVRKFIRVLTKRLELSAIPQPPIDSIFTGHEPSINKAKAENRFLDLFSEWVEQYGTTVLFHLGSRTFIFTADPDMMQKISTDLKSFSKVDNLPTRSLFGQKLIGIKSILSGNGIEWAVKRKMVSQFFTKTNVEELYSVCKPHMEGQQLKRWKEVVNKGQTIDLHDQLSITFTSYLHVLGLHRFMSAESIASNIYKLLDALPKQLSIRYTYLMSSEKNRMFKLIQTMRSDAKEVALQRYKEMRNCPDEPIPKMDLLGHLIEANTISCSKAKKKPGTKGSKDNTKRHKETEMIDTVVDDIMTVCIVMDNMVKQISALFMLLNDYPEIQQKMFTELRESPIDTLEDLNNLKYTEKCLLESLRMAPALLRGTRTYMTTRKNKNFGAYVINAKAVRLHYSEYVMHMNPKYWPNPKKFDPERFDPERFDPEPFSYIPFFVGARGCLGKHMAMMMMKLTLSVLAKNFELIQQFDAKKPPKINQSTATMRIINTVDCYMKPLYIK